MDPFRLSATVTHADGSVTRWAEDELDPENQPAGLNFTTQNPGGFGTFSLTLPRGLEPGPDEALLDTVTLTGPGGQVACEGRVHRLPRQQGETRTLTVSGVGWSAHLSDHRAFREIYRDCVKDRWQGMSGSRRASLAPTYGLNDGQLVQDATTPAVQTALPAPWTTQAESSAWYDASGITLGALAYFWQRNNLDYTDTNYQWLAYLTTDGDTLTGDNTGNLRAAGAGYGYLTATTSTRKHAALVLYHGATYSTDDRIHAIDWTNLIVYGNHGLARRGAEPDAGYYASDIIRDVIQRAAPKLTVGTLEDGGYVIPQVTYTEPTSPEQVILDVNKYQLYDWFVWEDREFTIVSPDPQRLTWQARLSDGAEVSLEGDDVVQLASAAYVYFTDVDGRDRVYGPTGAEFCDYTSDLLLGDGYDPYTDHGINAPITFKLSTPATPAQALQIGRIWLAEQNAPTRSGQIKISGLVEHPTEGKVPCWRVRAGDHVQIMDRVGDTPRKIVSTSYDHASRSVTCTMQSGPLFRIEGLLARLGVEIGILG
jgi:hypothetical protein